jgi:aryl-phospho-beta-D-glucosidase BglC (GH1 family)
MFKRIVLLFLVVYVVPFVLFAQEDPRTGAEMVTEMGRGINLGNVLSAPTEGDWAAPVTEQYFIDVAAAGFTNVRIPVDFFGTRTTGDINGASTASYSPEIGTVSQYTGETFTIDSDYLERVKTVINWSIAQGLVTILDFHGQHLKSDFVKTFDSDEGAFTSPTSARRAADNAKFRAIWTQLALEFEDHSYKLVFEIINEPYFHMSKDDMDTLNDEILAIIRVGGNNPQRNIIVTGGGDTSYNAIKQIDPILFDNTPNRLIGSFHYYNPYDFTSSSLATGNDYDWGAADQGEVDTHFTSVKSWTDANDVPVFLGEFGADNTGGYNYSTGDLNAVSANSTGFADGGPDNTSKVAYFRYVSELAISKGFSFAAWDAGPKSNKTIHKRTDNPLTVNFQRSEFSVTSYDPKVTTVSTVFDTSVWVEDVKNAIINPLSNPKNLLSGLEPTFTPTMTTFWKHLNVGSGEYDSSESNTVDGSGSWEITSGGTQSRLEMITPIPVTTDNYTLTFYVKGTAGDAIRPAILNGSNKLMTPNNYTITTTGVWEKVVGTWDLDAGNTGTVRFYNRNNGSVVNIDDVSLVLSSDPELSSPARSAISASIFSTQDGDWESAATWAGGVVPSFQSDNVTINNEVAIRSAVAVNDLTLGSAGKLIINTGKSINIANNLDIDNSAYNSVVFNAGGNGPALLKIGGTYNPSGNRILYNHKMNSDSFNQKWLLIAAPLENATIANFLDITKASQVVKNETKTAFAPYDDTLGAGLKYTYFPNDYSGSDTFVEGKGYATQLDAGSGTAPTLQFRGKLQDTSPIEILISDAGNGFNLVGNPYSTFLFANSSATSATNNLLTANTLVLDEETMWIWDSLNSTFLPKNQDSSFRIAPTQGFFVKAASGGGTFSFAENMQTLTTDTYYKNPSTRFEINLFITTNDIKRNTTVRYINNRTTSFDNGSDSSLFGGDGDVLSLYTELVENNTGKKLAIQSLPNSNFENMVIPVGVNSSVGSEFTFTADVLNVPTNYKVYLEDRTTNIITRLDEANAEYKVSFKNGNTSGRFYLHVKTSSVLSTDTNNLSDVSIYTTSNSNLRVQGLQEGNASISIFNILGKQVFQTSLEASNSINIALPNLVKGFYLLQLKNAHGKLNKKIILE